MNIESQGAEGQGQSVIGVPEITSVEELDALLAQQNEGQQTPPAKPKQGEKAPATPPALQAPAAAGESGEGEDGGEEEEEEQEEVKYPSILHALNARHELGLNLGEDEIPTPEEMTEAVSEIITQMTNGVNQALAQYSHIDELLKDPEVKLVLEAKAQKKTLKDIAAGFITTPQGMSDDDLVTNDFKRRYPKATPEMIASMVEPLKKNGQFAAFASGLREQSVEEQRLSTEKAEQQRQEEERLQAEKDQRELQGYLEFVGSQTSVYGVPLTTEMKQKVVQLTTVRDENGMTYLDHALQSNEGTVLAILGIAYMKDLMNNSASLQGNRKNHRFVNKIFERPDSLQSGGSSSRKEEFDPALANQF